VLHCFGGTLEQAAPLVAAGFLVSLACSATYPRNEEARRLARELPLDTLVVETDSPYLPPQASRGSRNEPANVVHAVRAIAQARGTGEDAVARATSANAVRLFGLACTEQAGVA
jgi:TatD DNase family protein